MNILEEAVITKNKGTIKDFPPWFRKKIYECIKQIDIDEIDEMLKDPDAGAISCTEFKGLNIIIGKDKIIVFVRTGYYDTSVEKMGEDKIFTFNIPRNELEDLIKEDEDGISG